MSRMYLLSVVAIPGNSTDSGFQYGRRPANGPPPAVSRPRSAAVSGTADTAASIGPGLPTALPGRPARPPAAALPANRPAKSNSGGAGPARKAAGFGTPLQPGAAL